MKCSCGTASETGITKVNSMNPPEFVQLTSCQYLGYMNSKKKVCHYFGRIFKKSKKASAVKRTYVLPKQFAQKSKPPTLELIGNDSLTCSLVDSETYFLQSSMLRPSKKVFNGKRMRK